MKNIILRILGKAVSNEVREEGNTLVRRGFETKEEKEAARDFIRKNQSGSWFNWRG